MNKETTVIDQLFELADNEYKNFHSKLIPTVDPDTVIGVRTPALRRLALKLNGSPIANEFLTKLPHQYYDENNLHAFLIEQTPDYLETVKLLDKFLPFVDNWATCDMMSPRCFFDNTDRLVSDALRWIKDDSVYTVRYGICMLIKHYTDENYKREQAEAVCQIENGDYYVKMAVAWYFATLLTKNFEEALPFITGKRLQPEVHNKAIQKACESLAIPKDRKEILRKLRIAK